MCLAIVKPSGLVIPEEHIKEGWISNPDGGGYGFIDDEGKPVIRKGFRKLKEFVDAYKKDEEERKDTPFLVHFRICTMGSKGDENTHPFYIENGLLIHNGTISGSGASYGSGKSDTAMFAEAFSKDLSFDFVFSNKKALEEALAHNKVAMLFKDKRWSIINEEQGYWDGGIWYSNRGYLPRRASVGGWPYYEGNYYD